MSELNNCNERLAQGSTSKSLFYPKKTIIAVPTAPLCGKCQKAVYAAESVSAAGRKYHKLCLKCSLCGKLLDSSSITEHAEKLYCKSCYSKTFGPQNIKCGGGTGTGISLTDGTAAGESTDAATTNGNPEMNINVVPTRQFYFIRGGDICPRCLKVVYMAEKINAAGKTFHKLCFTCNFCRTALSSNNCCDNNRGEVFCKACYAKHFGPKGFCNGLNAGTLSSI